MAEQAINQQGELLKWIEDLKFEKNAASEVRRVRIDIKINKLENILKDMTLRQAIYNKLN